MLTKQEIFNIAWTGLKAQGFRKALNSNGDCVYRARNGTRCAVGMVLPDHLYEWEMDNQEVGGTGVINLVKNFPKVRKLFGGSKDMLNFLSALQGCHDSGDDEPEDMERQLRSFAKRRRLSIPTEG